MSEKETMEISQEQFENYLEIQFSGVTNMMAVSTVSDLTGISRDEVLAIMNQYGKLKEKYPEALTRATQGVV